MNPESLERSIERLVKLAGPAEQPSAEGLRRARSAAIEAWQRALAKRPAPRPRRGWWISLAVAASVGVVASMLIRHPTAVELPTPVAHVVAVDGYAARLTKAGSEELTANSPLFVGSMVDTGDARLAATYGAALSLRLDRRTRVRFDTRDGITLLAGAVYVDSGGINVASSTLRIVTPAGEVRHLGTQYMVSVANGETRVRVREGRVLLAPVDSGPPRDLAAGDELATSGARSTLRRGLPAFGPEWEWAADVAPALDIENRPLEEFLSWLAREHGWQVRYASEPLQRHARDIRLHGSIAGLDAAASLERMRLVTGINVQLRDGVVVVEAGS